MIYTATLNYMENTAPLNYINHTATFHSTYQPAMLRQYTKHTPTLYYFAIWPYRHDIITFHIHILLFYLEYVNHNLILSGTYVNHISYHHKFVWGRATTISQMAREPGRFFI